MYKTPARGPAELSGFGEMSKGKYIVLLKLYDSVVVWLFYL